MINNNKHQLAQQIHGRSAQEFTHTRFPATPLVKCYALFKFYTDMMEKREWEKELPKDDIPLGGESKSVPKGNIPLGGKDRHAEALHAGLKPSMKPVLGEGCGNLKQLLLSEVAHKLSRTVIIMKFGSKSYNLIAG